MRQDSSMRKILENLELILTAAGLLVIFAVHILWEDSHGGGSWLLAAATAIAVGVIHGVIFWLVRRRQRQVRRLALKDAQRMLKDIVNNQLCLIQFTADLQTADPVVLQQARARIGASVQNIHRTLEGISEEALNLWKEKYSAATVQHSI
jgi:hypothetical protein